MVLHKSVRLDPYATEILAQLRGEGKRPSWSIESPLDDEEYVFVGSPGSSPTDLDRRPYSRNGPGSTDPLRIDTELNLAARSYTKPRSFADWWMLDLRSYGLKIHYNTSTPGYVTWMGQDELLYKDLYFTIGEFRGFIYGLVGETRRILRRYLLLATGARAGGVSSRTVVRSGLRTVRRGFVTDTAFRNVFIEDGIVALATKYYKGFYASNDAKIIYRFLPREVGELLVWYLWLHGTTINVSVYRNIAIGISRRFLRESSVFPQNQFDNSTGDTIADDIDDEASMDPDYFQGYIADLQAGYSSYVAGITYGREVTERAGTTAQRREFFRLSSTDWYRFLGFPDVESGLGRLLG
ncbi:uncharacterized protein N7473_004234 [Penicillium subrubescens]|uniref:uncharacterized protein n=1 Tax=Penicillium subrubescens TaxID=1316194 RepID=UPI0025457354|nr:uncharacterized protein N7473_004234 [Penicillium subrubescens]KAJ5907318.1 hypothetical protein N7473_004234 [Penicillium subrubescens]